MEVSVFGHKLHNVPILVVKNPTDPSTIRRKALHPVLLGMNVLSKVAGLMDGQTRLPQCLQPALREAHLETVSVRGLARVADNVAVPAHSMSTVRVTGIQKPQRQLLAVPPTQSLPGGLLVVPSLVSEDYNAATCELSTSVKTLFS